MNELKTLQRSETKLHREVYRPWGGKYDSVDSGERFQVKRITVNPGGLNCRCKCIIIELNTGLLCQEQRK